MLIRSLNVEGSPEGSGCVSKGSGTFSFHNILVILTASTVGNDGAVTHLCETLY